MIKITVYYKDGHAEYLEVKARFAGDVMETIAQDDDVAFMRWE